MSQQRPLKILVIGTPDTELIDLIIKLRDQGHDVDRDYGLHEYDLIIGSKCCRVTEELVPYIDTTIKEVQRGKYAKRRSKKVAGRKRIPSVGP